MTMVNSGLKGLRFTKSLDSFIQESLTGYIEIFGEFNPIFIMFTNNNLLKLHGIWSIDPIYLSYFLNSVKRKTTQPEAT